MCRFIFTIVVFCFGNFRLYCGSSCNRSNSCKSCKSGNLGNSGNLRNLKSRGKGNKPNGVGLGVNVIDWDKFKSMNNKTIEEDMKTVLNKFLNEAKKTDEFKFFDNIADILLGGKIGLRNVGNTCYLNSSLQMLFRCKSFIVSFLNIYYSNYGSGIVNENKEFFDAFLYLILKVKDAVENDEGNLDCDVMEYVIGCFGRALHLGGGLFDQNDSNEFITCFLQNMSIFLNGVTDSFGVNLINTIICSKKHERISMENANFLLISLGKDGPKSMQECINAYENIEDLEESEYAYCDSCILESIQKSKEYKIFMDILTNCEVCKEYSKKYGESVAPGKYLKINDITIYNCEVCRCVYTNNCKTDCFETHKCYCENKGLITCDACKDAICNECKKNGKDLEYCRENDHKAYCDEHHKMYYTGIQKKIKVSLKGTSNRYILILLKRYEKGEIIDRPVNIDDKISFDGVTYKIRAVAVQSGGLEYGHYYSYVNFGDGDNSEWFEFDDSRVTKKTDGTGAEHGYLFLYERCDK